MLEISEKLFFFFLKEIRGNAEQRGCQKIMHSTATPSDVEEKGNEKSSQLMACCQIAFYRQP